MFRSFLAVFVVFVVVAAAASAQLSASDIAALQEKAQAEGWTFTVGENSATKIPLSQLCGRAPRPENQDEGKADTPIVPSKALPSSWDWRDSGGCTPIKNQGSCGSCWAFGTIAPIESAILLADGVVTDLSEQWLVSCNQDGYGCIAGGYESFEYFLPPEDPGCKTDPWGDSGAVMEADFPYVEAGTSCGGPYNHSYFIDSWSYVTSAWAVPPTTAIKQAIYEYGPVTAGIYAEDAFQAYTGGVFGGSACQEGELPSNHQIVLVGWDDSLGDKGAWILRNSWSEDWGEDGYMYIEYECNDVGLGACYCIYAGTQGSLHVMPISGFQSAGPLGGPFSPDSTAFTVTNNGSETITFEVSNSEPWLEVSFPEGGDVLEGGGSTVVTASLTEAAESLYPGTHEDTIVFAEGGTGVEMTRAVILEVEPEPPFCAEAFDSDPGWTTEGQWAFGVPQGECGDPDAGYTGDNVYGYNLAGCYTADMPEYALTSTAFDCSAYADVVLRFRRWLSIDAGDYDSARVEVSNDNATWTTIWENGTAGFEDGAWQLVEYDISSVADLEDTVYVRWTLGPTDGFVSLGGWNIDDVELLGSPAAPLQVLPFSGLTSMGYQGGPFSPSSRTYTISNDGSSAFDWSARADQTWVDLSLASGTLAAGASTDVTVSFTSAVDTFAADAYEATLTFTNVTSGFAQTRAVRLDVVANPGEIEVTDTVPPEDDLAVIFDELSVGQEQSEEITITNTDATYPLVLASIATDDVYEENFEDGQAQDWSPSVPAYWAVADGEYRAQGAYPREALLTYYEGAEWADVSVEATVRRDGELTPPAVVFARATSNFNWQYATGSAYVVSLYGDGTFAVARFVNGETAFVHTPETSPLLNTGDAPNTVRLSIVGPSIEVHFNGELAWSGEDEMISEPGLVGLACSSGTTAVTTFYFDDVTIEPYPRAFSLQGLPSLPYSLAAGDDVSFTVRYAPQAERVDDTTLRIVSNDADEPEVAVGLVAEAYAPVHIDHEPLEDTFEPGPYLVEAVMTSRYALARADMLWSIDGGSTFTTVAMTDAGEGAYTAEIPAQDAGATISYYLEAEDANGGIVRDPDAAPGSVHAFEVQGIPNIEVSPAALSFEMGPDETEVQQVTIRNTGDWPVDWAAIDMAPAEQAVSEKAAATMLPDRAESIDWTAPHEPSTLLVGFREDLKGPAKAAVHAAAGGEVIRTFSLIPVDVVRLPEGADLQRAAQVYRAQKAVAYAEPNVLRHAYAIPDDALFESLWGLDNQGQTGGTADADIDAPEAWDVATGSPETIVAVIDTGIDYDHPDLEANLWQNEDEANGLAGVDDDRNGIVDDIYGASWLAGDGSVTGGDPMDGDGHGTHCSGTIAAVANNNIGVAGVCWNARIMALKFLDDTGSGYESDAISAIEYAVEKGARILSNSWGGSESSSALEQAIEAAGAAGVLFVAAAGNTTSGGTNNDLTPEYPASYECANIISVAASDHQDQPATFSHYGVVSVDLAAPGVDILSTVPNSRYGYLSGTSMATPHVSGAAALLLGMVPEADAATLKSWLLDTTDLIPQWAGLTVTGGRLNVANAALRATLNWLSEAPDSGTLAPGESTTIEVTVDTAGFPECAIETAWLRILGDPDGPETVEVDLVVGTGDLVVAPVSEWQASGVEGGPFHPASRTYTLTNTGAADIVWEAATEADWLDLTPEAGKGILAPGEFTTLTASIGSQAQGFLAGAHSAEVIFSDTTHGVHITAPVALTIEAGPPAVFFHEPLDTYPSWSVEGGWAFGAPQGNCGDPSSGYTGEYVYGYRLDGCYPGDMADEEYLETPALDCSAYSGVVLRFQRWLGVEDNSFDEAAVYVSNDGVQWTAVWANTGEVDDGAWIRVEYDISAIADGQETVYVRWAMGPTDSWLSFCGWNIDDIELLGEPADGLHIVPGDASYAAAESGAMPSPLDATYTLWNTGGASLAWSLDHTEAWLDVSPPVASGGLAPGESAQAVLTFTEEAAQLDPGAYTDTLTFTNNTTGFAQTRLVVLNVTEPKGVAELTANVNLDTYLAPAEARDVPEALTIANTGRGALNWSVSIEEISQTKSAEDYAILLYADDDFHFPTYIENALDALELDYTGYFDGDFAGFLTALEGDSWDLVILANSSDYVGLSAGILDALLDHLNGGGKLVVSTLQTGFYSSHSLWAAMGVTYGSEDSAPPDPVYWWNGSHALFTIPESVPEFTDLTEIEGGSVVTYGHHIGALPEGDAVAGYTESDRTEPAIVIGAAGRSIYRAFSDVQNDADTDADGELDGVELWTNMVAYLLEYTPWVTASPNSGTLAPGESTPIDLAYNAGDLETGAVKTARIAVYHDGLDSPASLTTSATVTEAPAIYGQPESQTVDPGSPVTFTLGVAGVDLTYQWHKDGGDISGATEAAYTIAAAAEGDEGAYSCTAGNLFNFLTSNAAELTVNDPPEITAQPGGLVLNPGEDASFSVEATGSLPLSYQWLKDGVAIADATDAEYTISGVAENDEGSYACAVSNSAGQAQSDAVTLTVNDPPVITAGPSGQTVALGAAASFQVEATGEGVLTYLWLKDGAAIEGATLSTFTIAAVTEADGGAYACAVTNMAGTVTSASAQLEVLMPPAITRQPESRTVSPGEAVSFSIQAEGASPMSYQWAKDGAAIDGATGAAYAIASASESDEGAYTCAAANALGSAESEAAALVVGCATLAAPESVLASDGTYTDRIRITWSRVDDTSEYQVYRSQEDSADTAEMIATTLTAMFDDVEVEGPAIAFSAGCVGATGAAPHYFYWVRAVNACGEASAFSPSDEGWVGGSTKAAQAVAEPALPLAVPPGAIRIAGADSALYLRLRADGPINPMSVWCTASAGGQHVGQVDWLPLDSDGADGWVVCAPSESWTEGGVLTVTAGAQTISGEPVESETVLFAIDSGIADGLVAEAQPGYENFTPGDFDLEAEGNASVEVGQVSGDGVPALESGIGTVYFIGPQEPFTQPQRVWLPIAGDVDPDTIEINYLYSGAEAAASWFPADWVSGWLVPGSEVCAEIDGVTYYGFAVRHPGVVQLSIASGEEAIASASALPLAPSEALGDFLLVGAVLLALAASRRHVIAYGRRS